MAKLRSKSVNNVENHYRVVPMNVWKRWPAMQRRAFNIAYASLRHTKLSRRKILAIARAISRDILPEIVMWARLAAFTKPVSGRPAGSK